MIGERRQHILFVVLQQRLSVNGGYGGRYLARLFHGACGSYYDVLEVGGVLLSTSGGCYANGQQERGDEMCMLHIMLYGEAMNCSAQWGALDYLSLMTLYFLEPRPIFSAWSMVCVPWRVVMRSMRGLLSSPGFPS